MASSDDTPAKPRRQGKLRWMLGWVVLPLAIISALFLAGVHVGARHPDMALSRLVLRMTGAKPGVAAPPPAPNWAPRAGAKPGVSFDYSLSLSREQLDTIAAKTLTPNVDDLVCEDVCQAWAQSRGIVAIYSIDHCRLSLSGSVVPSMLVCRGKAELVEAPTPAPDQAPTAAGGQAPAPTPAPK